MGDLGKIHGYLCGKHGLVEPTSLLERDAPMWCPKCNEERKMSEKYCKAGGIECGKFDNGGWCCATSSHSRTSGWTQCPCPEAQQPIEKERQCFSIDVPYVEGVSQEENERYAKEQVELAVKELEKRTKKREHGIRQKKLFSLCSEASLSRAKIIK